MVVVVVVVVVMMMMMMMMMINIITKRSFNNLCLSTFVCLGKLGSLGNYLGLKIHCFLHLYVEVEPSDSELVERKTVKALH